MGIIYWRFTVRNSTLIKSTSDRSYTLFRNTGKVPNGQQLFLMSRSNWKPSIYAACLGTLLSDFHFWGNGKLKGLQKPLSLFMNNTNKVFEKAEMSWKQKGKKLWAHPSCQLIGGFKAHFSLNGLNAQCIHVILGFVHQVTADLQKSCGGLRWFAMAYLCAATLDCLGDLPSKS